MATLKNLLPLIVLLAFVGGAAWIGYQVYLFANGVADRGKKHMERKNVTFSREGVTVGVKAVGAEEYADKTQSVLVSAWNNARFPGYRSRLWGNGPEKDGDGSARKSSSSSGARSSGSRVG